MLMDSFRVRRYDSYKVVRNTERISADGNKSASFAGREQIDFNAFLNTMSAIDK